MRDSGAIENPLKVYLWGCPIAASSFSAFLAAGVGPFRPD